MQVDALSCAGEYIGDNTSCLLIDCARPVTAPLLSIFGLVAAAGALVTVGIGRLVSARRRRS